MDRLIPLELRNPTRSLCELDCIFDKVVFVFFSFLDRFFRWANLILGIYIRFAKLIYHHISPSVH